MLYSRARGQGFETYLRCVVSLSKTLYSPKVIVIRRKRWLRPNMTKKLLTRTLSLNINENYISHLVSWHCTRIIASVIERYSLKFLDNKNITVITLKLAYPPKNLENGLTSEVFVKYW